jgi:enediyne biosynthesis protein E4
MDLSRRKIAFSTRAMIDFPNVFVCAAAAALLIGCDKSPTQPPGSNTQSAGPSASREIFEEVAVATGIDFIHDTGAKGEFFMPEQAGSGCALFDFNNDGLLDVYLIHCGGPQSKSVNQLFQQEAPWKFKNVSAGSGLDFAGYGMGVATGDINNDGWIDLVVTEYGRTRLLLNRSGKFADITAAAGVDNPRWGSAVSFFDYDRDGWLDFVVGNYLDYNPNEKCFDAAHAPEYCGPRNIASTVTRLFHNRGSKDVGFEDATVTSGFTTASGAALGILCADFDGDRYPDVFISDDGRPNRLFMNQKNGAFKDEAARRGVGYTGMGVAAANMGVAVGDVNGDALFDFFVTHLATEQHTLWVQRPRGLFIDETGLQGLATPKWKGTGFGDAFVDFDHDGWLDLAFANGAVRRAEFPGPRLDRLNPFWSPYAQRNQIFINNGAGKFIDVSENNPAFCGKAGVGRGLAAGDLDNDGDLDLLVVNAGGPAQLFKNIGPKNGHWLSIRAIDPQLGGRDAFGAELIVKAGARQWWRLVQTSHSYLSSSDPRIHIGLGANEKYDSIQIVWPDGSEQTFPGGAADREITLRKGSNP